MFLSIILLIVGFVLLIKGADWLVEGAAGIARKFKIPELIVGLTVVSFGTSAPELLVNITSGLKGQTDLALGNIIGSNISNTLLVLGVSACITTLVVKKQTTHKEIPFAILSSFMLFFMANDVLFGSSTTNMLSRSDGLILLGFFSIFLYYTATFAFNFNSNETEKDHHSGLLLLGMIIVGAVLLNIGGTMVVNNAINIATKLGISQKLIGLTLVAIGTSVPELVTSVIAASKGKADLAIGNVVGSNIFNIAFVLAITSIITPLEFNVALNSDLYLMIGTAVLLFFIIHSGNFVKRLLFWSKHHLQYNIVKREGILMLVLYGAYIFTIVVRG